MRDEQRHVVDAISAFLDGSGRPSDWDHFTSLALRDVELDRIRRAAAAIDLPLDGDGEATLQHLLAQAELAVVDDPAQPEPWRIRTGMIAGLVVGGALYWANHLDGAGLFHNLHLLIVPAGLGAFIVMLRNSRLKLGAFAPRVIAQNKKGRV